MSVRITYEYVCDICSGPIRETERYEMAPFVPAQNAKWPIPSVGASVVWDKHVCQACLQLAIDPLIKRHREITPPPEAPGTIRPAYVDSKGRVWPGCYPPP